MNKIKNGGRLTDSQVGVALILPGLAVFAAIILYPFVDAILMSFTDRSMLYPEYHWVNLDNYAKVFRDPYFGKTLLTTALFVLGSTVLPYVLGMIWAVLLDQGFRGAEFLRGVTLVNWIIPGTAIGFLWSWIFNGQYGILNSVLQSLGILDSGSATLKFVDNSKSFVDTGAHWASSAVDFVSSRDLFQGTSPSEFSPDMPMNRAMLVTVLHRLESEPNASAYSFNDVPTDSYYAEATAWAVGMGITNGMDGAFNGDGTITREMLATMLYRYVQGTNGSKGTSGSYASMGDAGQVNTWADDAMRWAVGSGIITGDNGNLRPGDPASRAEVATMLERFVTVIAK